MDVLMPQLGETVAEGKVTRWFKAVGDKVAHGENLCEIETDKVTVEVPAIVAGVLQSIGVAEGTVAPVGAVLAVISDGSAASAAAAPSPAATGAPHMRCRPPPHATEAASSQHAAPTFERDLFREVQTPLRQLRTGAGEWHLGHAACPAPRRRGRHRPRRDRRQRPARPHRRQGRRDRDPREARGASRRSPVPRPLTR